MSTSIPSRNGGAEFPRRIVCLTEETVETLYLLGEDARIVGVSGYAQRPPEVKAKPRVGAFANVKFDRIVELKPDLVLTFSDVQAEITRELVKRGVAVWNFNQRTVAGILDMIAALSRMVGQEREGRVLIERLAHGLDEIAAAASVWPRRPRVYFEEWDDPLISGIGWVEELIAIGGGEPVFPELLGRSKAQDRVVNAAEVAKRDPEVILASWCGKKVDVNAIAARPGWSTIDAVREGHVYEIDSTIILQPGPAALTDGVREIHRILARVASGEAGGVGSGSRSPIELQKE